MNLPLPSGGTSRRRQGEAPPGAAGRTKSTDQVRVGGHVAMEAGHRDRPRPERDDRDESRGDRLTRPRELADLGELTELGAPLDAGSAREAYGEGDLETDLVSDPDEGQSFRELRPQLRLRIWQIVPIVALGVLGSLMFAFPLAFESG